jgi:tight adherence protein C
VIVFLLLGLLLLASAVAFFARSLVAPRLRTADTLTKIQRYGFSSTAEAEARPQGLRSFLDPAALGIGDLFTNRLKLLDEERLRKQLLTAGMYRTPPRTIIGYSLLCALAYPTIWIALAIATDVKPALAVIVMVFFAAGGWVTPGFVIQRRAESRLHRVDHAMPELIDLLVVTVEAGLSLAAAIQLAGERMRGPLGEELRIVIQEQRMGLTPVQALENMVGRCPSPAVESFVRAMMQGQMLGFSIGQILRTLAIEMRKRRRARAEQQAQKAPIKMLFPLIFMIFPALFVILLGPALVSLVHALGS